MGGALPCKAERKCRQLKKLFPVELTDKAGAKCGSPAAPLPTLLKPDVWNPPFFSAGLFLRQPGVGLPPPRDPPKIGWSEAEVF